MRIYGFSGEYRFLSNFYHAPIEIQGIRYPTTEHAFQAAKTTDKALRAKIAAAGTAAVAKAMGRRLSKRSDWEDIKENVMRYVLFKKFRAYDDLRTRLLATGEAELIEANTWGDRIWGVDAKTGVGENRLGLALMAVRAQLLQETTSFT